MISIYTDGGARGNPGPAAVGIVIVQDGKPFAQFGKYIGPTTNNVAEYTAVIEAFAFLLQETKIGERIPLVFHLDSLLVVSQLTGVYKIKDSRLKTLAIQVKEKEKIWGRDVVYRHIPREQNRQADILVNQTLDTRT